MRLQDVQLVLKAEILCCHSAMDTHVYAAYGADLMSDVLRFADENTLLITGLTNMQAIRTAEISDAVGIVFVRGKRPQPDVIQLANRRGIPLLITHYPMYEACGLLYQHGLPGSISEGDAG